MHGFVYRYFEPRSSFWHLYNYKYSTKRVSRSRPRIWIVLANYILVSSEIPAITALLHAYGAALKDCSTDEVLSLYTEDGVFMAPGFQASVGSEAIRKSYDRVFGSIKLVIDFDILEIINMSPEWAFARTTAEGTKSFLKGGEEFHNNQELFVVQKVNGKWKIARYCFSSMKPVAWKAYSRTTIFID